VEAAGEFGVEAVVDGLEPGEEDAGCANVLAGADGVLGVLGALGAGEGHIEAGVGEVALVVGGVERGGADVAADDQGQGLGGPGHALVMAAGGEPGPAGEERRRGDAADEQAPARRPGGGSRDGGLVVGGEDVGGIVRGDLLGFGRGLGLGRGRRRLLGRGLGLVRGVRAVGGGGRGHGCLLGQWWMGASAGGVLSGSRRWRAAGLPNRPRAGPAAVAGAPRRARKDRAARRRNRSRRASAPHGRDFTEPDSSDTFGNRP